MTQNTTTQPGLSVRSALKAGAINAGAGRADQPDRPNRRNYRSPRRLALSQFGVNEHGVPTFTKA